MAAHTGSFPRFDNGNVKIILSGKPADTLLLHTAVLGNESSFFKASLENVDWSHNKYVWVENGKQLDQPIKVLELDFDGSGTFPLLLGTTVESSSEKLTAKLEVHNIEAQKDMWAVEDQDAVPADDCIADNHVTPTQYHSNQIIMAYKIGFALLYKLRIDWSPEDKKKAAWVIPAIVDFADAYGLLPALSDRINSLIFGHKWSGHDIISASPFHMLRVACKLQSQTIFEEAMRHAVGLDHALSDRPHALNPPYSSTCLAEMSEPELQECFNKHVEGYSKAIERFSDSLLTIQPRSCNKIGVAKNIGTSIFRDWVIENVKSCKVHNSPHEGLLQLADKSFNVSGVVSGWAAKDWHQEVGVRFGHVHRAVESCFHIACNYMEMEFRSVNAGKGTVVEIHIPHYGPLTYFANLNFVDNLNPYKYPWEDIAKVPEFCPFPQPPKPDEASEAGAHWW